MSSIRDFGSNTNNNNGNNNGGNNNNNGGNGGSGFTGGMPTMNTVQPPSIEDNLINYNELARKGKFSQILHRDETILNIVSILRTLNHPNVLLIGEAGTGKTGIVEEIARRIENTNTTDVQSIIVRDLLKDHEIFELRLGDFVSGKRFVGDIEQSVKDVIEFASDSSRNIILFIDEIHMLMEDNSESPMGKIAEILKPALARDDLHVIGATTTQEGRKLHKNKAFQRRFSKVIVPELTREQTFDVLQLISQKMQAEHKVIIPTPVLHDVIRIADDVFNQFARPDNALTLLDRACSDIVVDIRSKIAANPNLQNIILSKQPTLTVANVQKSAFAHLNVNQKVGQKHTNIEDSLKTKIIGQSEAIKVVADELTRNQLRVFDRKRPTSFLFAGLTGTGKTELAKRIAELLFGSKDDVIYLNMTEYTSSMSQSRLIGSAEGFIGSNSNRKLPLDDLETNPYQVVILDEFEKAHADVQYLFMQALDEGFIETNRGNKINFQNAIIIGTTNAGTDALAKRSVGFGSSTQSIASASIQDITKALATDFPPELINRFENVVAFNALSKDEYKQVLKLKYNNFVTEMQANKPGLNIQPAVLDLDVDYDFLEDIANESYNPEQNGRPAERTMRRFLEDMLIEHPSVYHFDMTKPNYGIVPSAFSFTSSKPDVDTVAVDSDHDGVYSGGTTGDDLPESEHTTQKSSDFDV